MRKYFKVLAKCGHVGKGMYYEGAFYVKSDDAKKAAAYVRKQPRVKHDHKDAIISVVEITKKEYVIGREEKKKEAYFNCVNSSEQKLYMEEISLNLKKENRNADYGRRETTKKKVFVGKKSIRNPRHYFNCNRSYDISMEIALYA